MRACRRAFLILPIGLLAGLAARSEQMAESPAVIDDLSREAPMAAIGTRWQLVTDQVMGGVSRGTMAREVVAGRLALRMRGEVSLENNGGFVQLALDLATGGGTLDATAWRGIELDVFAGEEQEYGVHLRTAALTRPWESYRQSFGASPRWQTIQLPFAGFRPHRTAIPLDTGQLRRLGIVAIGRKFTPDLSVGGVRFLA